MVALMTGRIKPGVSLSLRLGLCRFLAPELAIWLRPSHKLSLREALVNLVEKDDLQQNLSMSLAWSRAPCDPWWLAALGE